MVLKLLIKCGLIFSSIALTLYLTNVRLTAIVNGGANKRLFSWAEANEGDHEEAEFNDRSSLENKPWFRS